ncbi:MAG: hypothetical protein AAAC47_21360 [Pararhizobium sp.]
MIDPHVIEIGNVAVLTFRFVSHSGSEGNEMRWNCTEVYSKAAEHWQIVQTHGPSQEARGNSKILD